MEKNLKEKAISIKGKDYVMVKDRVLFFNETYPEGSIVTELLSDWSSDKIVIKATIYPDIDKKRMFTGLSQAIVGDGNINKTAALENAETSAVGRALAMMGIGVLDSIASVDEINKATGSTGKEIPTKQPEKPKDARPFLTAKLCDQACSRILQGEKDIYEKTIKTYQVTQSFKEQLDDAFKTLNFDKEV